jgi:hypothetical protein
VVSAGLGPSVSFGFRVGGRLRVEQLSVGLEAQAYLPNSASLAEGRVTTSLVTASVAPCVHRGVVSGCAILTGGAMQSVGADIDRPASALTPVLAMGLRAGAEVPLTSALSLAASADLLARAVQVRLQIDDDEVWSSPLLHATFGLQLLGTLP